MEETFRERRVKNVLAKYPQGIHFNALYRKVKDAMALQTLANILKDFEESGLVTREPKNPRKGQKVFYKSTTVLQKLDKDVERMWDTYRMFLVKLIMIDYFAKRGHQFKLQFVPRIMDNSFNEDLVKAILLAGIETANKYRGKTRRELQEITVKMFLSMRDRYFQFLCKHPKIRRKISQYRKKEIKKAIREIKKAKGPFTLQATLSPLQATLSQAEKQRMFKDFSDWIEGKSIKNKDNLKKYFKGWLM